MAAEQKRRRLVRVVVGLLLIVALGLGWNRLVEGMIFQPSAGASADAARLGIAAEDVFLTAADGIRIHAYWLSERAVGPGPLPRAILFLHGNAGNASHRLRNAAELASLGAEVLVLDYRGYGRSEGRATEPGVYLDARAGLAYLVSERGIPLERIVVFGRSLGGAVAVDLAQDLALAGLVLESTFTSVGDVAGSLGGPLLSLAVGARFESDAKVARLRSPVLFFHGDRDRVIDYTLGRRLFELTPGPKAFETIPGAGHNDTVRLGGRPYFQRLRAFLDQVAPARVQLEP